MDRLVTAVSPDGRTLAVAVAVPTSTAWRVALYTDGGRLQTTLTAPPSSDNSSNRSRSLSGAAGTHESPRKHWLAFLDSRLLAGVSSSSPEDEGAVSSADVVVWDLDRGVVAGTVDVAAAAAPSGGGGVPNAAAAAVVWDAQADPRGTGTLFLLVGSAKGGAERGEQTGSGKTKSVILQYGGGGGTKLVRKIRTKHWASRLMVVVDGSNVGGDADGDGENYWLVTLHGTKLRIHSGASGKSVRKVSLPGPVLALASVGAGGAATGPAMLLALLETGAILRVPVGRDSDGTASPSSPEVLGTYPHAGDLVAAAAGSHSSGALLESVGSAPGGSHRYVLVGGRHLVRLDDGCGGSPAHASSTSIPLLDAKTMDAGVVRRAGTPGTEAADAELVAVLCRNGSYQVRTCGLGGVLASGASSTPGMLAWLDVDGRGEPQRDPSLPASKRLKSSNSDPSYSVLGPAQTGGDARRVQDSAAAGAQKQDVGDASPPAKRARTTEEPEETVGARLARLRAQLIAEEEEEEEKTTAASAADADEETPGAAAATGFQPKKATTESLSQLLQQALCDDSMLELCLAVTSPSVIKESVSRLNHADVSKLVALITSRLAHRPARADTLCSWLQALLHTRKASLDVLQPLNNLITERVEVLPALLQLEGRLSLLGP